MNFKKLLSGPFVWILLALLVLIVGTQMLAGGGYRPVSTSTGLSLIQDGKAAHVAVYDGEQRVDIELAKADK
ncbi:MAG: cell division protein rane-bound ATP-dependent protease, partial [Actinomycetota bacterium]